jgi:hypothetical protein
MSGNLKDIDNQVFENNIKSLLERTRFAREWTGSKPNAVSEILSLAKTNPIVKGVIIEDAAARNSFALLSELAKTDEEAKQALIEMAKKGRIPAINELSKFPNDKDVQEAIIVIAKKHNSSAIPVLEDMLKSCEDNKTLRDTILEINNDIHWYGIHGLAFLARSDDEEAKNRLFELALKHHEKEAISEIYYWSYLGNEEAKRVLFGISKQGNPDAIRCLRLLAHNGDEESLDLLLKLSTDSTQTENGEYRICFAIRELVSLINEDVIIEKLKKEATKRIINKINEIGKSGDYEALGHLRDSLQNIKFDAYHLSDIYPELESLITFLVGKPTLGMSIYDPHYYDRPTVTYVTRFSPFPDERHEEHVRSKSL